MVEFNLKLKPLTDLSEFLLNIRTFVRALINDYSRFKDKKFKKKLRSSLRKIYFSSDGVLWPLAKYLESGDRNVLKTLPSELNLSSADSHEAFSRLKLMSEDLANESIDLEDRVKNILLKKFDPNGIRDTLVIISTTARTDVPEYELHEKVEESVLKIQDFNKDVKSLHRML